VHRLVGRVVLPMGPSATGCWQHARRLDRWNKNRCLCATSIAAARPGWQKRWVSPDGT